MTASPSDAIGEGVQVGEYTLLAKIGEGGMGIVHLARRRDGDRVALKVLRPHIVGDDEARHRLAREVSSLRRIRSRWVAEIVDADPWAPIPFVATRYVPGLSLHDHVVDEAPISGQDLVWFASCLAEGIASVHSAGVLHRDVKPSNVLMEGRTPILIDFGLARVADDPKLTHTGWLLGTPGYLAPEILYGDDATTASDVHSWASTVAFAATGKPPFGRGPSMAIMDRVRRGEHDLTGVPASLQPLLAAALDPEPAHRPTLDQIIARLRPLADAGEADRSPTDRFASIDPLTLPIGAVSHLAASRPTDVLPDGGPGAPAGGWPPAPRLAPQPPTPRPQAPPRPMDDLFSPSRPAPPLPTRVLTQHGQVQGDPLDDRPEHDEPARVGLAERSRRAVLLLGLAGVIGMATAAFPWWTIALVVVLVWLLRSGSLAASAAGDRRRTRGAQWHDGIVVLARAPWDMVRSLPASVLLILWSAGLAVSAALICYAFAASESIALGVTGTAFAVSLWTGPGGSRVRSSMSRVVHPVSRPWRSWLTAVVILVAVGLGLGFTLAQQGSSWFPGNGEPLRGTFGSHGG